MRWFLVLVAVMSLIYRPTSDGFPSDDNETALYSANKVVGDILPQGADEPFQRLVGTNGGGWLTTNTDPSVVGVDPLTLEDAPTGTDVGFAAPIRRYIQTSVLNGDFSQGPPDPSMPISDDNPLPYWTWTPDTLGTTIRWQADSAFGSGYIINPATLGSGTSDGRLWQMVPVPISQGQQYRVLLSVFGEATAASNTLLFQFYEKDGTTAIGSERSSAWPVAYDSELKIDAGLVPPKAAYLRVAIQFNFIAFLYISEVRVALLPAEATLGLKSRTSTTASITTSQTQVVGITIPANTFTVGSVYEFDIWGNVTSSAANTVTMRLRVGTTTLTGNIIANVAPTATTTASNNSFHLTGTVTVRTVGASGTIIGGIQFIGQDTQPFTVRLRASQETATVTVDTTVANILEATIVTGGATTSVTVQQASIRCVMAS